MIAMRENNASAVTTRIPARASVRAMLRSICASLRRVRDWPDPDSPYAALVIVSVAAFYVLMALAFR